MEFHLEEKCPQQEVPCPFADAGCDFTSTGYQAHSAGLGTRSIYPQRETGHSAQCCSPQQATTYKTGRIYSLQYQVRDMAVLYYSYLIGEMSFVF